MFGISDLGCGVWGSEFGAWGLGFRVLSLGLISKGKKIDSHGKVDVIKKTSRFWGQRFCGLEFEFGVWGSGFVGWGVGFGVWGVEFSIGVQSLGCMV